MEWNVFGASAGWGRSQPCLNQVRVGTKQGLETQVILPIKNRTRVGIKVICRVYFFLTAFTRICSFPTKIPYIEMSDLPRMKK